MYHDASPWRLVRIAFLKPAGCGTEIAVSDARRSGAVAATCHPTAAPEVVADQVHRPAADGIDQRQHVPGEIPESVIATPRWPGPRRVTALIGRQAPIALCDKAIHDGFPAVVELRPAVQQNHRRPVGRSPVDHVERQVTATV